MSLKQPILWTVKIKEDVQDCLKLSPVFVVSCELQVHIPTYMECLLIWLYELKVNQKTYLYAGKYIRMYLKKCLKMNKK